jgi:hypothetical protein
MSSDEKSSMDFPRVPLSLLFVFSMAATILGQDETQSRALSSTPALPSLEAIKSCLKAGRSAECLDILFQAALLS